MRIDLFTLFPAMCRAYLDDSILLRAQEMGALQAQVHNIRDWTTDKHKITDDTPFGGGGGMVMKPEPIFAAMEAVLGDELGTCPVILMSPLGRTFTQQVARELATLPRFALLCGRYEGVDERVREQLVTDEISLGDFVLTGGELPALAIADAVTRLLPGVLGAPGAADDDSFSYDGLLEYPHYTRPAVFRGWQVPEILLSGHHAKIVQWRREQALRRTRQLRPDLLASAKLSQADRQFLQSVQESE
ncbi:MAG TPA: tRNA (guanosine(37)-N1)-methyltransferase TrmD [Anaerolineales bacterium]|nr:tRNA (guanosine(37)-N1)-methyltransferase TrmD [Anaerolineales bacterium]